MLAAASLVGESDELVGAQVLVASPAAGPVQARRLASASVPQRVKASRFALAMVRRCRSSLVRPHLPFE